MRKIIASEMITVDGYFAGKDGALDWFVPDEELNTVALDLLHAVDTILYGKATYEMMAGFWPHATGSFADRTNRLQNPRIAQRDGDQKASDREMAGEPPPPYLLSIASLVTPRCR